jgi:16S rRNA G966 N2-methylase RsmD
MKPAVVAVVEHLQGCGLIKRSDKKGNEMQMRELLRRLGWRVWSDWPQEVYQQQSYQQRLSKVQEHFAECLDNVPRGPVRVLSLCAGDGRDVIGVLNSHPRRTDVSAWLIESNRQCVAICVRQAASVGLQKTVNFVCGDATLCVTYKNIATADIVLICGVWGHVAANQRAQLVAGIASLCKPDAAVIWTRGLVPNMSRMQEIQSHFAGLAWNKVRVSSTPDQRWAVATYRYSGPRHQLSKSGRLFRFRRRAG